MNKTTVTVNDQEVKVEECETMLKPLCEHARKSHHAALDYLCMVKEQVGEDVPLSELTEVNKTIMANVIDTLTVSALVLHLDGMSMKECVAHAFEGFIDSMTKTFEVNQDEMAARAIDIQKVMENRRNEEQEH